MTAFWTGFLLSFAAWGLWHTLRAWRRHLRPRTWQQHQRDKAADLARERRAHRARRQGERNYSDVYPTWRG